MKLYKEPSNVSNWFWFRKSNTRENLYCYFTKALQTQKRDVFRTQFVSISQATNLLLVHHLCGTESMSGTNIERNIIETYAKVIWKICIEPNNHYITIHRFLILTKKKTIHVNWRIQCIIELMNLWTLLECMCHKSMDIWIVFGSIKDRKKEVVVIMSLSSLEFRSNPNS